MGVIQGDNFDDLQVTDIRVVDVASLPPTYFLRESVIEQLKREIRRDVLSFGKPVPPGAEAVFGRPKFGRLGQMAGPRRTRRKAKYGVVILAVAAALIGLALNLIFGGK